MCGENMAGLGSRSSVVMLSGVSGRATDLAGYADGWLKFVLSADGSDVDKRSSGRWPGGIPIKGLASQVSVP
jgi:hypothetical protein